MEIKTMPREKLDKVRIRELLQKADDKWYAQHSGRFNYQSHLDFVADYIVKHYKEKEHARRATERTKISALSLMPQALQTRRETHGRR